MKTNSLTIQFAVNYFNKELKNQFDSSELNQIIQITFLHYFNLSRTDLILLKDESFSYTDFEKVKDVVKELKTNKPLAQLLGEWEFYGLNFKVNEHTLIPRPETEELVQLIVNENKDAENLNVLDIGTGTGCIALALKKELSNSTVLAIDVSEEALKVAKENSQKNELEVDFRKVDILRWEDLNSTNKYDIIVSNPPYISVFEKKRMHKNVLDYEPHIALFVNDNKPLLFYDAIADFSLKHLSPHGKLYFEINENLGEATKQLLTNRSFKNVTIVKDMNGKDRILSCQND